MHETSATEFIRWKEFLKIEANRITPERAYLAQIALEGRRSWIGKPKQAKLKDFYLKWETKISKDPQTADEIEAHKTRSKTAWSAFIFSGKKKTRRPPPKMPIKKKKE